VRRWENGFEIHNLSMGSDPYGKLALAGKTAKVRYVGRLATNGKVFDKSGPKPFAFRLGVGQVIKGWDKGVEGMRVGDKRKLVIPPQMAYGSQKMGSIPPNSTLEFEVRTREPESAVCMHVCMGLAGRFCLATYGRRVKAAGCLDELCSCV
jgi:FK506-binding nuclear protein